MITYPTQKPDGVATSDCQQNKTDAILSRGEIITDNYYYHYVFYCYCYYHHYYHHYYQYYYNNYNRVKQEIGSSLVPSQQ